MEDRQVNITDTLGLKSRGQSVLCAEKPRAGLRGGRYRSYTLAERLEARTVKSDSPDGCWIVQGYQLPNGYVQISRRAEGLCHIYAHRLAYELAHGPIPEGKSVLHKCDEPRCCRPDHLSVGTQGENVRDASFKNRRNAFGIQKLHPPQVREIRALLKRGFPHRVIAEKFGVARNTISGIACGASWGWLKDEVA